MINDSKMQNDNKTGSSVQFHGLSASPKPNNSYSLFSTVHYIYK